MSSRKRRAPGASPVSQQPAFADPMLATSDQFLNNWHDPSSGGGDMGSFGDPSVYNTLNFSPNQTSTPSHNRVVSLDGVNGNADIGAGQLVRRNPNQQIAARGRNPWDAFNGQQSAWENVDDDEELERKAIEAKRDALAKRKQIPPFVQKLSSFLDNNKNSSLIRWSDDGNSFIVLDEDEFARTLIPELFKHNNYASFVRQLNMYGFHKKVGLSDNSMKASETKAKAPSEYYNKYFKRGRPELLWLIQKPKSASANPKRKREDDAKQGDSDEDRKFAPDGGGGGYAEDLAVRGNQEMAMIPRSEYNSLRAEVRALQQQQKVISNVLGQIRRQNEQLYQQATAFQTLHDRHENSINAILTFLATFYNRSLEGNTNVNIADMFGPAVPSQPPHGNVVDVGDYSEAKPMNKSPQMHRAKRPLALLPAPAQKDTMTPTTRAATLSPSARSAPSPLPKPASRQQSVFKSPVPASRPAPQFAGPTVRDGNAAAPIKVDSNSPPQTQMPLLENDEVMSAIQQANAHAHAHAHSQPGRFTSQAPQIDLPAALNNYQTQDGHTPLTPQQRNDVLSLMANSTSAASPNSALATNTNNALVNPLPPPLPSLDQFADAQAQLDMLSKFQQEQDARLQNVQERLVPLSPSGQIPGLSDTSYFGDPGQYDLDLDSFVQGDDFFPHNPAPSQPGDAGLSDLGYQLQAAATAPLEGTSSDAFHFADENSAAVASGAAAGAHLDVTDAAPGAGNSRVESVSSSATSPAATVEEVEDESRSTRSPKRLRK